MTEKILQEGMKAPDFTLVDQNNEKVKLSQFRGQKNVVLYFYPKDMTPGCTTEACSFTDYKSKFAKKDAIIFGVSFDDPETHRKFIEKEHLKIDLLSDTEKKVADQYGVYQEKNMYGKKMMGIVRTTFVIDKDGVIKKIFPKVKVEGHSDEVLAAV